MNKKKLGLKDLDLKIANVDTLETDNERNHELMECITLIQSRLQKQEDGYLYYLLGYCYYGLSGESEERFEQVEKNLLKSIRLDKNQILAYAYLCHFYFDNHLYSKCIQLTKLNKFKTKFEAENQKWRYLKLVEIYLCSLLYLNMVSEFSKFFEVFQESILSANILDLNNILELKHCLALCKNNLNAKIQKDMELFLRYYEKRILDEGEL